MKKVFSIAICLTATMCAAAMFSSCSTAKSSKRPLSAMSAPMGGSAVGGKGKAVKAPMRPNANGAVDNYYTMDHSMAQGKTIHPVQPKKDTPSVLYKISNKHRKYMGQDKKARRKTGEEYIVPMRAKSLGQRD